MIGFTAHYRLLAIMSRRLKTANKPKIFIGRKKELAKFVTLYKKRSPSLCVIKGRRRIGKSRLASEFAKTSHKGRFWSFAGLAPDVGVTHQQQIDHFARQLSLFLKLPSMTFNDWSDALEHLSLHFKSGDIVLFDEISWMGGGDPTFIPKLKAWWDKQNRHIMLILCGSISTWIEENILNSTAFFGRINLTISLEPLSIPESAELLKALGVKASDYDLYKILGIVGGIPWYLEQYDPTQTADENIKRLAFERDGLLVTEFDRLFYDLFNGKGSTYKKILYSLRDGAKSLSEIRTSIKFAHSGTLSKMIEHLIVAGFINKQPLWSFKTGTPLKQSLYAISDPYMRFYLKVIAPNIQKILRNGFSTLNLQSLPGFESHLGMQIEHLLLQNRALLLHALGITDADISNDGSYRQNKSSKQRGVQIDYLIQTRAKNLYICEFKFKRRELTSDIIREIDEKIKNLKAPRGFAKIPVLFHIGGVSDSLAMDQYFYRIINLGDLLSLGDCVVSR